jgi:hypothetical protein
MPFQSCLLSIFWLPDGMSGIARTVEIAEGAGMNRRIGIGIESESDYFFPPPASAAFFSSAIRRKN